MRNDNVRINPALYLAHTVIGCWRCGETMPAVALIASNVPQAEGQVCILSEIEELPEAVLHFVRKRFLSFKFKYSKTTGSQYYANTCPGCRVISGDFYLHSEPGAPFFPTTKEESKELTVEAIPTGESINVRAGLGIGVGDLILKHAKRLGAGPAAAPDRTKPPSR